ncbi:helicase-related protein [Desulfotomaculum nigrificans]|uniref:helicase-related protein n=1 Tax=Desulfotomaculum nigrificans TaxID=1565 RepID=UPI0001FAECC6|nr:helicase-related protein [Desulfotomaculum nigrificans]
MDYQKYYEARAVLEDFLIKDLLGPVTEDEIIDTRPSDYYITGRLFPQGKQILQTELEKNQLEGDTEEADQPLNLCYEYYPSSMAISFTVAAGIEKLLVETEFAWYVPVEKEKTSLRKWTEYEWHRQYKKVATEISTCEKYRCEKLHDGLELCVYLQTEFPDGTKTVTVSLLNSNKSKDLISDEAMTFFQPKIIVKGVNGEEKVFTEKKMRVKINRDPEMLNLEMLYRHNKNFAVGHGCSVGWKQAGDYASCVWSEFISEYELMQMEPAMIVSRETLSFEFLGNQTVEKITDALAETANQYESWIADIENGIKKLPDEYKGVAAENVKNCRKTLRRMRAGIKLLSDDRLVFIAFQLVNQAMLRMRIKQHGVTGKERYGWYPFQLAFILQELCSVADPANTDRDLVDLLWFPTGGGKTEAYLGLTAFTIFLRRMKAVKENRLGGGVTVIMRYTLRLLTLQQFERATALICACELIRKENQEILGTEEIAAGLFVGPLTPNKLKDAEKSLETIKKHGFDALTEEDSNPCQILTCSWCGSKIRPVNYEVTDSKMVIRCSDVDCDFRHGLPVYLVDEDLYNHKPALVVATIDKFARMTWEPKVGNLFGLKTELLPPELIIQDELHLISGPLGTIAGLYEIAIDEFCRRNNIKPKIIASTATIRNAGNQVLNLYGRKLHQFPPQGTDIRNSYFAVESSSDKKPSRKYRGIFTPGTSGHTRMIRVYAAMLFAVRYLSAKGYDKEVVDSFWTLTGYFNSLKQLGSAVVNVIDDVKHRYRYLFGNKFKSFLPADMKVPDLQIPGELTSRKKNSEIGETLKKLEVSYPDPNAFDIVLASNMLSVGIDIGRLGLMVLQGQPKSNSEYIQATSRVGRKTPGLVLCMYDVTRSRDRSHYEQFLAYHSSLYKYVEATSLTPFAERARDRALHAVLISLCRHLVDGLANNSDAANISDYTAEVHEQIAKILEKVKVIDESEYEGTEKHLLSILEHWQYLADGGVLPYQRYYRNGATPLLTDNFGEESESLPTLNSMRNVDVETEILLEG